MPPHQHLHIGQSHPFPRYVLPTSAAEGLEDFGEILCGNATPVVADMQYRHVRMAFAGDDDLAGAARFEVGDGIRQEIPHDLFHGGAIRHRSRQRIDRYLHLALRDLVCQGLHGPLHERSHIERLKVEVTATETRQVQNGPDEVIHAGHGGLDEAQGFRDVLVKGAGDVRVLRRLQVRESCGWRDVLQGEIPQRVRALFADIAEQYDIPIEEMQVSPDHIHIFCSFPPRDSIAQVVTRFKRLSARAIFREFPRIKRRLWGGELWEDGYFARTVGDKVAAEVIRRYIQQHRLEKIGDAQLSLFE